MSNIWQIGISLFIIFSSYHFSWKYTVMQDGWKQEDELPTPCEVIEVVTGMYCMERVGIRHDLKAEVLEFLQVDNSSNYFDHFIVK